MVVDIEISNDFGMDLVVDIDGDEQQRLMMIAFSYLDSLRGLDFAYFWFFMTMMKAIKLFFVVVDDDGFEYTGQTRIGLHILVVVVRLTTGRHGMDARPPTDARFYQWQKPYSSDTLHTTRSPIQLLCIHTRRDLSLSGSPITLTSAHYHVLMEDSGTDERRAYLTSFCLFFSYAQKKHERYLRGFLLLLLWLCCRDREEDDRRWAQSGRLGLSFLVIS